MRNGFMFNAVIFFLGFVLVSVPFEAQEEKLIETYLQNSNGRMLFVGGSGPGNYSKIQDAIDNATNDDTVFVYDDSSPYYENIVIDKSITLTGENKTTTAIDARGVGGNVVTINVDRVIFSGLSVLNWGANISSLTGMYIHANNCTIVGNIFSCTRFWYGYEALDLYHSTNNIILSNIISHTDLGIVVYRFFTKYYFEESHNGLFGWNWYPSTFVGWKQHIR